jgi:type IV secretion system protein VirB10
MGGGIEQPDTRNDRLQAKSISGIKGLTSSRQNYAAPDRTSPLTSVTGNLQSSVNNPYAQFGMPAKEEYMNSMLTAYTQNSMSSGGYATQNNQSDKLSFINQGRENSGGGQWLPINSVWQGTIFEATLTSAINTDLPGECTAWVTKNVYSSLDGRFLLIPQNSRLYGSYNSSISYSQSRVQIGWHTLIRPDGYMINLGNIQATDRQGAAGLNGFINDHPFAYLKALGLITALNLINGQFNATEANTQNPYVQNMLVDSQNMANRLADKIIDRALDIQPTIIIKSGAKINIVANQTLTLPPLTPYGVEEPYHRGE